MVPQIFPALEGYGPIKIAKLLSEAANPRAWHASRGRTGKAGQRPLWLGTNTVVNILKKREYLGHTINFKTRKHFKDKKSHYVEKRVAIFENTHEAIIDQETFDNVQRIRANRATRTAGARPIL